MWGRLISKARSVAHRSPFTGLDGGLEVAALFVGFVLLRLPFRSEFLVNWDAVNFALGVEEFDVVHHQPHPPGYIGYVLLARGLWWLTGDANTSLTLLSVLAGGLAPAALYVLARRFTTRGHALAAAVLFGTAPLVWYYSSVALTYLLAAAVTLVVVWACHVARTERSGRHLLGVGVLLAALGALRQTDLVLMLPLAVYAAWPFGRRAQVTAGALFSALTAAWMVPLIWVSGGPIAYLRLSAELADLAGGSTWIFSLNVVGLLQNLSLVAFGIVLGMSVGLFVLPVALWRRVRPLRGLGHEDRRMLLLWAAPALVTYLFLHTGQMGYVLLVLPIGFLLLARTTAELADGASLRPAPFVRPERALAGGMAGLVAANVASFFIVPTASLALVQPEKKTVVNGMAGSFVEQEHINDQVRQYNLRSNDGYWRAVIDGVEAFDPDTTAVLAVPSNRGSFRHLAYYLPEYRIYGVGQDRRGEPGFLFRARDRDTDYEVEGLADARSTFGLPEGVRTVLVPDPQLQEWIADPGVTVEELSEDSAMMVLRVRPGSVLTFTGEAGEAEIRVEERPDLPLETQLNRAR